MYSLTTKPSLGTLRLHWNNGSVETYPIGKGRLSLTPYLHVYLVNFWIVTEYEVVPPDNQIRRVSGPILEILTTIPSLPASLTDQPLTLPTRAEAREDWDVRYRTGFYHQSHQDFNEAVLVLNPIPHPLYEIQFRGKPSLDGKDYSVTGHCFVELSDTLERYW